MTHLIDIFRSDIAPRVRLPKAARKTAPNAQPYAAKAARKRSSDTEGLVRSLGKAARKLNISSEIDDNSVIELSDEDEDIDDLLNAFDALTLGLTRLRRKRRLPYLRRNLRRGFEDRCARAGVPTTIIENPDAPVKVVYRFYPRGDHRDETDDSGSEEECQEWVGTVTKWICPLCPLYDPFNNRAMLAHHLSRDHDEVKASWEQIHIRNKLRWRITLVLPHYDTQGPEDSTSDNSSLDSDTDQDVKPEGTDDDAEESTSRPGSPSSSANISAPPRPPLFLPDSDEEGFPASAIPQQEQVPEEIKPIVVRRESETPEPPKPLSFSVNTTQQPESRAPTAAVVSYRGSLPARYPSPPPPDDPMGPAARFPYLPQTDDENRARYSCRIGGPRIYDLLNELSLEEFGIMSWAVVDREEELFEMDDVRDEDKVMLALWNRWIMLNKTRFIFDQYDKGVRAFIDQYWQLIHRAAGWRALRAFLMMLQVHRYLTIAGVVQILKYYEGKTGMKFWYQEAQEEAS
ncbi:hypothetical protein PYCCODRAFT_1357242 [Trametes coccinea BRFM310]|uniref:Uncharacterized protein n=1 Tax=Trametes coccinea (strain BRFM310) TaxID=1353009 RepID=A0A1Y2J5X7_TRAC3|nr:hypothetical protein PYCCODRAFT_1357242 [Trametes coccinea BRFM310]